MQVKTNKIKLSKMKEYLGGFLFISPLVLGILIFNYIPAVQSFIYSFFNYDGFYTMELINFKNFTTMFMLDPEIPTVFANTFLYAAISVPLSLILGYLVALLVNKHIKGLSFFRMLFYLPVVIPGVAAGLLWMDIFSGSPSGLFNQMLNVIGIPPCKWFASKDTAMMTLIFSTFWSAGAGMIIWLAAFKNIPPELYEAAKIDGANSMQRLVHITIPLSTSMIFFNIVTGIIGSLQVTSTFFVGGTEGRGTGDALYFIAIKIYNESFAGPFKLGYASAMGLVLFIIIAVLTAIVFATNRWVYYDEN